jgi:hypothetical protein
MMFAISSLKVSLKAMPFMTIRWLVDPNLLIFRLLNIQVIEDARKIDKRPKSSASFRMLARIVSQGPHAIAPLVQECNHLYCSLS